MPEMNDRQFAAKLRQALRDGLLVTDIDAKIIVKKVPQTRLHRVLVAADEFARLEPSETQDLVWRIVDQKFTKEDQLRISVIYTGTEGDLGLTPVGAAVGAGNGRQR